MPERGHRARDAQTSLGVVLEAAPDAVLLFDRSGVIVLNNSQAELLFGYGHDELLGQHVQSVIPEHERPGSEIRRRRYFDDPQPRFTGDGTEFIGLRKDGSEFPMEASTSPIEIDGDTFAMVAIRDVSHRRHADAKFRGLLEAAPDGMVVVDRTGTITLVNTQAQRLFGYAREELLGEAIELLVPAAGRDIHATHRARYSGDPHPRMMGTGLQLAGRRKDGSEFPVEISLSPVETEQGTLFTAAVRDITERLAADDELQRANRELEAFTYSVSHDLRAPIRQINGFARILDEYVGNSLDEKARHYLQRIQDGAAHMGRLLDDLLNLARLGQQDVSLRRVRLDSVLDDALADMESELASARYVLHRAELPVVECDSGLMTVVFANLLSNALKYSRPRDEAVIEVGTATMQGVDVVFVRDNGVGFDMRYADKLFGVFQRLHRAEEFEGTGVGLATVQRIVRKHGGEIWADAALDRGATFYFTLGQPRPRGDVVLDAAIPLHDAQAGMSAS